MNDENGTLDENPFSFQHFIKSIKKDVPESLGRPDSIGQEQLQPKNEDDELPFPEVQNGKDNQLLTSKKNKGKHAKKTSHNKPQELFDGSESDNPFSFKNFVRKDASLKTSGRVLQIKDDDVYEVESLDHFAKVKDIKEVASEDDMGVDIEQIDISSNTETCSDILKLKEENQQLRKELEEVKCLKERESLRVESLMKKLKEMQQKENEETVALEKMVHMVEKNLELTTQRAIQAEAVNVKLRDENKILKSNSVSKAVYDDLVNQHQIYLGNIRAQALSVSQHLESTAKKAEESIRQLCSEAESVKLASQLLASIDKFADFPDDSHSKS